ncbi:MAG: DMT family transporter, partial [Pseudomonadota bacterium]
INDLISIDWPSLPGAVWIAIAYLAVFTTAGTFFLLQYAVLRIPAGTAFAYSYLTPAFVIMLEGVFAGRWPTPSVIAGAVAVVIGLVIAVKTSDVSGHDARTKS